MINLFEVIISCSLWLFYVSSSFIIPIYCENKSTFLNKIKHENDLPAHQAQA